ncbi:autophagy-related 10 isoform X2 [Megachile rotundata]|uniref:autophagy-related 10 isoform X2 n=2 Tax=Megachile rotundata TaxID=143995 RepID=UPI003FD6A848
MSLSFLRMLITTARAAIAFHTSTVPMDGLGTITWDEFLENAESFVQMSNELSDGWELRGNKDIPGEAYIVRQRKQFTSALDCKASENNEFTDLNFVLGEDPFEATSPIEKPLVTEHHVLWSMSYSVPVLYFNGWKSDFPGINLISMEEAQSLITGAELKYTELSQAMHPILSTPFLYLHPCMSQELLKITSKSKNKLVSWLSTVAPAALGLKLRSEYCKLTL